MHSPALASALLFTCASFSHATPVVAPSPSPTPRACVGNCDGDRLVSVAELVRAVAVAAGDAPHALVIVDLDGDGALDIAVANEGSNDVSVLLGRGEGSFARQSRHSVGTTPSGIVSADLNGDGRADLATANIADSDVSVLLGMGGGRFAAQLRFAADHPANCIAAADLNGDRLLDLITASDQGLVSVLLATR